ncbi:MAG: hypothetical protein R3246_04140 [Acidimicrobiia bacterium]|nr:hypothetical protein [Acidimicrobiia bacterium]
MSFTLVRHLVARTLRWKRLVGMGLLASVGGVAAWIVMAGATGGGEEASLLFRTSVSTIPAATLSIALLVVTSAVLRDERDGGTLPYIYLAPMSSVTFAISASVAAVVTALVVAIIGWIPGWVGAGLVTGDWSLAIPALMVYGLAAVGYAAIALPLGYLIQRSLIVGLAYIFVWEGILASAVSGLGPSSIWRTALSGYAGIETLPRDALDVLGSVTAGTGGAIAKVAGLLVIGTMVLAWAVRFRDAV